ncbi:MAG: sulfite exporter TauE/SafE family protein [Eubacteriales bacterium]|nr:sulfite exporter TauE/SafE family protein [Eubacteriales bacterium]
MKKSRKNARLYIRGMTCRNCQSRIEQKLKNMDGIINVSVSYENSTAHLTYDETIISEGEIADVIEKLGYDMSSGKEKAGGDLKRKSVILFVIALVYLVLQLTGILNFLVPGRLADSRMGYGMLFVTGLFTSVHCIAMCGGINLTQCLPKYEDEKKEKGSRYEIFLPSLLYNLGRVFSYTMIGTVLGTVGFLAGGGGTFGVSMLLQGILKIVAGVLMVLFGVNMLGLVPQLRRYMIPMHGFIVNTVYKKRNTEKRPFWIGVLNGFMPCGPLQAMWIVALATGNPLSGAMAMFMFGLGTVPLMMGLGTIVSALGKKFTHKVMTAGAVLVVVLGLAMISQGGSLSGLSLSGWKTAKQEIGAAGGEQVIYSTLSSGSYPNITVQAGIPVRWVINAPESSLNGCNYKMYIQKYNIEYTFQTGENVIEFTPTETGTIQYSCWMGMIRGTISVKENGSDGNTVTEDPANDTEVFLENQRSCCGY